jgi:RNA polymerase sigma-70 factor (ECF subfamily)
MMQASEFDRLIADVAAGSEDAIWALADTYTPYIIRAIRLSMPQNLRRRFDSQDIAQALWTSILVGDTDLSRLKSPEALIAFLARAAKNKVIDQMRKLHTQKHDISREQSLDEHFSRLSAANRVRSPLMSRDATPSTVISVRERWQKIVADASERDRKILRLRIKGRSFDEISVEVNVSVMTARRAVERLVHQLNA